MKKKFVLLFILLIVFIGIIFNLKKDNSSFLVHITGFSDEYKNNGFGFVYKKEDNKYYIVTNYHVISGCESIKVLNNRGKEKEALIVNYDEYTDIAILIVNDIDLSVAKTNLYFKENDSVNILGSTVNNFFKGKENGIVLEKNKTIYAENSKFDAIKVKINVLDGQSGTPLLNNKNEVIGMVSLKDDTIAYAIPIDKILKTVNLLEQNKLERPNLGASFIDSTNYELINRLNLKTYNIEGIIIFNIQKGYPLYKANIKDNSIITKINAKEVHNIYEFKDELYKYDAGDTIKLELYIDGEYKIYEIEL